MIYSVGNVHQKAAYFYPLPTFQMHDAAVLSVYLRDLEVTGSTELLDLVRCVVAKHDVVDEPVDPGRRHSAGTARDVALTAGPRVLDAAVIGGEPRRNWTSPTHAWKTFPQGGIALAAQAFPTIPTHFSVASLSVCLSVCRLPRSCTLFELFIWQVHSWGSNDPWWMYQIEVLIWTGLQAKV